MELLSDFHGHLYMILRNFGNNFGTLQNKSKKTIELIEHYEKLKNLEIQIKEEKVIKKKENKKFSQKPFKKKPYFKKKYTKKSASI